MFVAQTLLARLLASLEKLESALLSLVSRLHQVLQGLLAEGVLLLADDATALGLHQIGLDEATGGVLRRSVENLRLRANRGSLRSLASLSHFCFQRTK